MVVRGWVLAIILCMAGVVFCPIGYAYCDKYGPSFLHNSIELRMSFIWLGICFTLLGVGTLFSKVGL